MLWPSSTAELHGGRRAMMRLRGLLARHEFAPRRFSSTLVTFGEALLTFKPAPPMATSLPLGSGASLQVQAVGGAELNVAVAFARAAAQPSAAAFISALPTTALGDAVIRVARSASVATDGVARIDSGEGIGTLHVVDDGSGPRPLYQRQHSAFCASTPSFDWASSLKGAQWLHLTGITPLLGTKPREAWEEALFTAERMDVLVSVDLNHRPSLGSLDELWRITHRHLDRIHLLTLSEDTLYQLANAEGIWPHAAPASHHDAQLEALARLRERWGVPLVSCCFKRARIGGEQAGVGTERAAKDTLMGSSGVRRWSAVASGEGVVSSASTPVEHVPVEALGGGDAWVAGFLHAAVEYGAAAQPSRRLSPASLDRACRRGDMLAALSMGTHGDQSSVDGETLAAAERRWEGATALLLPATTDQTRAGHLLVAGAGGSAGSGGAAVAVAPPPPTSPPPSSAEVYERLSRCRLVPVVALDDPSRAPHVARALLAGGLDSMELVLRTPSAELALGRVSREVPEILVGAGTVLTAAQAERAVGLGARFLVSPGTNATVVRAAHALGCPIVPGVATASEVEAAMDLGLTHLKFFPAEAAGGPSTLKALAGPYRAIRWMPTGGISLANMQSYLGLPQVFCVGGSWLVPPAAVEAADYALIEELARGAATAAKTAQS